MQSFLDSGIKESEKDKALEEAKKRIRAEELRIEIIASLIIIDGILHTLYKNNQKAHTAHVDNIELAKKLKKRVDMLTTLIQDLQHEKP